MLDTVVFRRIRTAVRRFAGANEGNIAILFGIAVIPIISFVGAAVDYTRANAARSSMQAALELDRPDAGERSERGDDPDLANQREGRRVFQGPLHQQ